MLAPVSPVSQRGDDQSPGVAQVLVTVLYIGRDHADRDQGVELVPIISQLADPGEVLGRADLVLNELRHYVSG